MAVSISKGILGDGRRVNRFTAFCPRVSTCATTHKTGFTSLSIVKGVI